MTEPSTAMLAYLPRNVLRSITRRHASGQALVGYSERLAAVVLFADVSGFTPISEALGRSGRRGSEELTLILNRYFVAMIDLVDSYGGMVGKFGGDAFTALFAYTPRRSAAAARRALQCALDMQAAMSRFAAIPTSAGIFHLTMKVGMARGSVLCTTVGDPTERLEYIFAGAAIDRCAEAERAGAPGEIIAHVDLLADLDPGAITNEQPAYQRIDRLPRRMRPIRSKRHVSIAPGLESTLAAYLHPSIVRRIVTGQQGFINEHRRVTTLFVGFGSFDYDHDPLAATRLQHYMGAALAIIQRYDGYLNRADMGDKGSRYIVLFGAPIAHEDDEERALRCALELIGLPYAEARVGANTGFAYCGEVGATHRKEYTVMGDPVNVAARLMQAAYPGQILAGEATWRATQAIFGWMPLEPIAVKGKQVPLAVYAVHTIAATTAYSPLAATPALAFVGRARELQAVLAGIERAYQGDGQMIGIIGEAGIGKSRLLVEVIRQAHAKGYRVYLGTCQSYATNTSYLAWRAIWRDFFGITPNLPHRAQIAQLERRLAEINPQLAVRAPLLAAPLNLALPDNELTATLEPRLRDQLLKSLLVACVRAEALRSPLLIVLEDCHWIDPLSLELLELIGRSVVDLPVALLPIARTHTEDADPLAWMAQLSHAQIVLLGGLPDLDAANLAAQIWKQRFGASVPPEDSAHLLARAQGNPLYLEELIAYIHMRSAAPNAALPIDLPDSLQQLILSRIDRLDTTTQATLKSASVIGVQIPVRWLAEGYPQLGGAALVDKQIDSLQRQELLVLDRPAPDPEYRFHHTLLRDTAYESLAFATRAALHAQLGDYIEQRYADDLETQIDTLAYHYGRADNVPKQRIYFRRAADAARKIYANTAAIDYYQRLLPLLDLAEQGQVLRALAEIWHFTGEWQHAEQACRRALALAEAAGDRQAVADCARTLGAVVARTQSYDAALQWLERARGLYEAIDDSAGLSRVLELLSFAHYQLGDPSQALAEAERQLQLATAIDDQIGCSDALAQIGLVVTGLGDFERALDMLHRSLEAAKAVRYRRRMVLAANSIAGIHWQLGDFRQALEWLRQAIADAEEIGYLWVLGLMIGNAGKIYARYGADGHALACYVQSLHIALDLGDGPGIASSLVDIGALVVRQGQPALAARICDRAVSLTREHGLPYELCEALELRAELLTSSGDYDSALSACVEACALATRIEEHQLADRMRVLELRLLAARGNLTAQAACDALAKLLDAAVDSIRSALILMAIWQIDQQRSDVRIAAAEIYRRHYAATPNAELRLHYHQLTGENLPAPPPLPELPQSLVAQRGPLDEVLARAGVA